MALGGFSRTTLRNLEATAAACEDVQTIINIAATAEALAVTALYGSEEMAEEGMLSLNEEQLQVLRAARAVEQTHFEILTAAGATPLTTTFTIPDPAILTDTATFLTTLIALEEAFIAAYMAAAQVFSSLGQHDLVQLAIQIGATEADHRAHARFYAIAAGVLSGVPNNDAFAQALFPSVGAAAQALIDLGFIGGSGTQVTYPGSDQFDYTGLLYLMP